jgi:CubicO group peptidase (beta-lactamase class C family)
MSGLVHPDQNVRNATKTACAGQLIDGEVVARAEPAIADGEPGSRGRGPPRKCRSDTKLFANSFILQVYDVLARHRAQAFGVARVDGEPLTPETLFQAGSISMPVTALAVLRLVE